MAFPSVAGTPTSAGDASATSFTCTRPAGIVSGELLLIFMAFDLAGAAAGTITQSSGPTFTQIDNGSNGTVVQGNIWARIADGSESADPVFSSTNNNDVAWIFFRVQNHSVVAVSTDIIKGTAATGSDAAPDPPNCNPGTAQDYLWLAAFAADDDDDTTPYEPANYTAVAQQQSANSTSSSLADVASRALNATAENPGAFAMAAVEEWRTQTIAIPPSAASPTRGRVSWAELEVPFVATRARVSWAELEAPLAPTRGRVSWAELETPLAPTRGRVSWAELETPLAPTRGRVSWAEQEVPTPATPTRGRVSWAELETPLVPTRGRLSWIELEAPFAGTRGRLSWVELEVPFAPTRGQVSWMELEVPDAPIGGGQGPGRARRAVISGSFYGW